MAERSVPLLPSATEALFSIGLGDRAAADLELVGNLRRPPAEWRR